MKNLIKKKFPWQLKILFKIFFGILKIDYKFLKKAKLVEHGKMENHVFAINVYKKFEEISQKYFTELHCLGDFCEIGPGDSILSGVIAYLNNFKCSYLVDVGDFEVTDLISVKNIFDDYNQKYFLNEFEHNAKNIVLKKCNIKYLINGLNSLETIPSNVISFSFSNTVLQHINKSDFFNILKNLYRIHKQHSCSIHVVNFSDHFSGGFNNLNIPNFIWESKLIKNANIYTNRIKLPEMIELCIKAGFDIISFFYFFFGE